MNLWTHSLINLVYLCKVILYFLQPVMRKTLLLRGLDLVRPCPGHERYTKPAHTSQTEKTNHNNRCRAKQVIRSQHENLLAAIFSHSTSSLFNPLISKSVQHFLSPDMDNSLLSKQVARIEEKQQEVCSILM